MISSLHKFANNGKLESIFKSLKKSNNCTESTYDGYKLYHYSAINKLWCADQSLIDLKQLITTTKPEAAINGLDFLNKCNRSLDGFFYFSGCALDILSREVLNAVAIPATGNVYFGTAHTEISKLNASSPLLPKLEKPTWKDEFSNYRNAATHENLLSLNFKIEVSRDEDANRTVLVLPLPDDPRKKIEERTFETNTNSVVYAETTLRRIFTLFNGVYGQIHDMANAQGHLPITP